MKSINKQRNPSRNKIVFLFGLQTDVNYIRALFGIFNAIASLPMKFVTKLNELYLRRH